jgi:hypothetical protein
VVAYLDRLWSAILDVLEADKELPDTTDPAAKSAAIAKRRAGMDIVTEFHATGKPLFAKYMRFSQRVPSKL